MRGSWWLLMVALPLLAGATGKPVLTMDGFGPIRIGMTRAQVEAAAGPIRWDETFAPAAGGPVDCWEGSLAADDVVHLMFDDGRLVRVSFFGAGHATLSGASVGMPEARVRKIYGSRLLVEGHHDFPDGHRLKLFSRDGSRAMMIESDGQLISTIHAGETRYAQLHEGCI